MPGIGTGVGVGLPSSMAIAALASEPLHVWWQASAGVTLSGADVLSITDTGGLGHNAGRNLLGTAPQYNATGWSDGGPLIVVNQGNSDRGLLCPSIASALSGVQIPYSLYFLGVMPAVGVYNTPGGAKGTSFSLMPRSNGGGTETFRTSNNGSWTYATTNYTLNTNRMLMTQIYSGTTQKLRMNGVTINNASTTYQVPTTESFTNFALGGWTGTGGFSAGMSDPSYLNMVEFKLFIGVAMTDPQSLLIEQGMVARRGGVTLP